MLNIYRTGCVVLLTACLGSCAMSGNNTPRQPLPDYASPIDNRVGWVVKCPLRTITNTFDMRNDIFRNEDGSTKSYEQFCEENDTSRRTAN